MEFIHALGPLGTFLLGIAAIITAFMALGSVFYRYICKYIRKAKEELIDVNTANMQAMIAKQWSEKYAATDPSDCFTLDVEFETGHRMKIPMYQHCPMMISENIEMAIISHSKDQTIAVLDCKGFGHIPSHRHEPTCEVLEVREGTVTHLESGRIYRSGESWTVPPGEFHSAIFQNAVVFITYRPPLKTAKEQPADFSAMKEVFATR